MKEIVAHAAALGNFIRIDMEDSAATDDTLSIYRSLRKDHSNVGIVLAGVSAANLTPTPRPLLNEGLSNVRLCKGIYVEPEAIAFKERPRSTIISSAPSN